MVGVARLNYDELNSTLRYAMWSVFRTDQARLPDDRRTAAEEFAAAVDEQEAKGVVVRGVYDLAGMRADADWLVWTHAPDVESLQAAYTALRRTALGRASVPVWSSTALHRPAEFNKSHVPAFIAGEEPKGYLCLYPFVRSLDWYLLPDADRRQMLADHGKAARGYADVRANTVPAFALGDYEWILAFESDQLDRIVDLMRDLRATEARRHVREEVPFFTGPRVEPGALLAFST
jgi:peroxiredoxin